jgi:hypothetical protein
MDSYWGEWARRSGAGDCAAQAVEAARQEGLQQGEPRGAQAARTEMEAEMRGLRLPGAGAAVSSQWSSSAGHGSGTLRRWSRRW